ncbi:MULTISPECIES: hypothetical protein [unclassified Streptomyces]|uniref:hypothetical protein n=1 Tax=unclassified Streptomyces TaxID=2593676 RepID=UPI00224E8F0A|nr:MULTISPECIES: hypothetical protein [unclassified Streptomyces]MCX4406015.1 hypothetical protein [Streptomyces sp. NBC_01764]MCX5189461.1 hypothetical protein [Streptomyces sp. NBC_00268]
MSVNQAPGPDEVHQPAVGAESSLANQHTNGEPTLWGEALPWVDEVGGTGDSSSTRHPSAEQGTPSADRPTEPHAQVPVDTSFADGSTMPQFPVQAAEPESDFVLLGAEGGDTSAEKRSRRRGRVRAAALTTAACAGIVVAATLISSRTDHDGPGNAVVARSADPYQVTGTPTGADVSVIRSLSASPSRTGAQPSQSRSASASAQPSVTSTPAHAPGVTHAPSATAQPHPAKTPTPSSTPTSTADPYVIQATAVIQPGQSIEYGKATLTMTSSGDLVVTDERNVTRWATHTSGSDLQTVFQNDGLLAVYDAQHKVHWSSYTSGNPGAVLAITYNGNVQIRLGSTVLWQTGTGH